VSPWATTTTGFDRCGWELPSGSERRPCARRPLAGQDAGLRGVDVDASGKVFAVTKEHERPQRRIVLVLVEGSRHSQTRRRIDPVLDERAVEPDQHDVSRGARP
jgi:hypothetical protein